MLFRSPTEYHQHYGLHPRSFFMQSSGDVTRSAGDIQLVTVSNDLLKSVSTRSVEGTAFYIYNYEQSAYVIVSGDDRMKPVLGYSDNGSFITENLPVNILGWLELYNAAIAVATHPVTQRSP